MTTNRAHAELDLAEPPAGPDVEPGSADNVGRIREILFGAQIREYKQRFLQMEQRFLREIGELKAEVHRHLDSLEMLTQQETEALADRISSECNDRAESAERLSQKLSESVDLLGRQLRQSEEQVSKELREFRKAELDRHNSLSDELMQSIAAAGLLQGKRLDELRTSAVDRTALADFLTELALRIRSESGVPPPSFRPNPALEE